LKPLRDTLAEELRDLYPSFATKLADLLDRIAANDDALGRLNQSRPNGPSGAHLLGAELVARELGGFSRDTPSITKHLQLPDWSDGERLLYPPPKPSPAAAYAEAMAPAYSGHRGADWWKDVEARQATERAESERAANFYEQRNKQKEDRENAEVAARVRI
jgi:hypothetical protein